MSVKKVLLAAAALAPAVLSQQTAYGQCGGVGWSGLTTCVSGFVCTFSNSWYSQCLPGTAPPASSATPTTTATPPPTTLISSTVVGSCGPAPSTTVTVTVTVGGSSPPSSSIPSSTPPSSSKTTPPPSSTTSMPPTSSGGGGGPVTSAAAGNPFSGYQFYANPYYSSEIYTSAIPSLTGTLATKASAVAEVGTFVWMDTASKVPLMDTYMGNIAALNAAGASPPYMGTFVVYDLPDRDCAAAASNGEYSIADNGVANYKAYIDSIVAVVKKYSTQRIILVIEPDSLANLVTNLSVPKCANAQAAYLECVTYAIQQLNLANVAMYLDAGHAGWLGWSANLGPAAQLFAQLYKNASQPMAVRGLATNVANYNGWNLATAPSYTQGDSNYDEKLYVNALAPLLTSQGFPAHFITDQSRSGVQPTEQLAWGDWCNVIGTGFGIRPSTNTGDPLEDAFVWVKPGGECDGTSNTTSARYDFHCGLADALQPAPEAGTWFQAYFAQLLTNANPSF